MPCHTNMELLRFKNCLIITGLMILLCCNIVYSAEVDVEVNTGAAYNSNVFRSFAEPEKDVYFTFAPKAALKMPFNKAYFSTNLRAALEQHVNQTGADLQELTFSGLGRYNASDFISFGLQDDFIVSGRLKSAESLSDVTEYREYMDNRATSSFKYEFKAGVLTTSVGYSNAIRNYLSTDIDDWMVHTGRLQAEYSIGHKTLTQLSVNLIRKFYETDVDYISIPIMASLKRNLSSKIDATFSVGLESRKYNEEYTDRNWNKPTVILDLKGKFSSKTTSRLVLHQKTFDSDVLNGYAFVSTACDASLALNLSSNAQLSLQGIYSRNKYVEFDRKDDVYGGHTSLQYRFSKWGAFVLGYGYERRTSNITNITYNQHTMELYHTVLF